MNLLVSACLLGAECRYCASGCPNAAVQNLIGRHRLIPVCPEQLGGLPTPREPVELMRGRAMTRGGADCTAQFLHGAEETLRLAKLFHCTGAVLKSRSPSCGFGKIYDGTFSGRLTDGNGITAEALSKAGIRVFDESACQAIPFRG